MFLFLLALLAFTLFGSIRIIVATGHSCSHQHEGIGSTLPT